MSLESLAALLGWCTVINLVLLVFSSIMLLIFRQPVMKFHAKVSGLSEDQLKQSYFTYLAQYKLLFLVFNLAPYLALRLFILQ